MEQVHLYKGEVAVMAGTEADHFFLVRHGRLQRIDIDDKNSDYAENEMLGVPNVLRRQAYRHTYVASLTTTLVKLDHSVITDRLVDQPKPFQLLFDKLLTELDGG